MCGIAGVVSPGNPAKAADAVARMTDALARRGPDGCGVHRWPAAVLGHRRLAIFDLSAAGDQPMLSRDGRVGVVFNGAIYNFLALRSDLEELGHAFTSRTDTEVLVEGYLEWGMDGLLERIRGMFAFALWDERTEKLWLVRDRLGVKPLVYSERDGTIAFASTIRALRAGGYGENLEPGAVLEYLRFGFVPDEESIYGGIRKVPAATVIEWSEGRVHERTYWSPPAAGTAGPIRFEEAVEETERLLLDAVQTRLQADVPVGALLSGGIDSSLVCWAIARLGGNITAFTIGTPGDPWDEAEAARQTARRIGISHQVLDMTDSEPPDIDELLTAYSEPFACASALGMLRVSRAVKPSAKVLLTGDGGDDVFLGYPRHRHLAIAGSLAGLLPSALEKAWLSVQAGVPRPGPIRRAAALLDYTAGGLDEFLEAAEALPLADGLLGPRLSEIPPTKRRVPRGVPARQALAEYLEYERRTQFVAEYMTKVDGATMYYGLEARSPFLDQRLWEFASSLPLNLRLRRYRLKAVLRELARRRIGPEVSRRHKQGFGVPVHRWIKGRWRDRVHASLRDSHLVRGGWVRPEPLRSLLRGQPGTSADSGLGWRLFVLESWLAREAETGSGGNALPEHGPAAISGGRA
jgi:asparagine synthase (glutamine-hydrolysing)